MKSPILRVVLLSAFRDNPVLYAQLPREVQRHVDSRLVQMVEKSAPATDFDAALIEMNPAPSRVANHYKWRATLQVRVRLRIPRLPLEIDLIRAAYPEREMSRVDLSGVMFELRALSSSPSLIDFVAANGLEGLRALIFKSFSWAAAPNIPLQQVISRYRSITNGNQQQQHTQRNLQNPRPLSPEG